MKTKVKIFKIIIYTFFLIQLIGLLLLSVFYFEDIGGAKSFIKTEAVLIAVIVLLTLDVGLSWGLLIFVTNKKSKYNLQAAEVIGEDIQEAYNFAMLGLAVTNDDDIVLWTNDLFKDRHIDIIDENILSWQPVLAELKEKNSSDAVGKLVINNRNFEVKFLSEAGLWIFKDTTDFENIYKYSKDQAPVIGILSIDNFDEVVRGEEDYNDTIAQVKNIIFDYAKTYGVLLRRYKDSNYAMLCNYDSFLSMKNDKFSLINKVREASEGEHIPLTLSIGIATDFPDVVKLNELANAALGIAISRGGDQVVVSAYGKDMEFYGGKTEAQEKRNRVRVRVLADSLINLIDNAENVLIMGHTYMDMDALGSCLGIKAICERIKKKANLVIDFKNTEPKARAAITSTFSRSELDDILVSSKEAVGLINANTLIVVVDVHTSTMVMAPDLLEKSNRIVVIDHHRRAEDYIEAPVFDYIDPSASSATEIITELIRYASISPRIEIPANYATIMLAGIFLDSDYYKSNNTGMRTFESSTILKEFGANNSVADDLLKDDFEEYVETTAILKNLKTLDYGVVCSVADEERIYDQSAIAKAAQTCLSMKGIHASFVIGKISNKEIKVSARSDGFVNVSILAEKLGGGGHFTSAAATFLKSDVFEVEKAVKEVVDKYLKEARSDTNRILKDMD